MATDQAGALVAEQARVARALERIGQAGWLREPDDAVRERLTQRGHFPDFPGELAWTPCEISGHLGDSALIFSARIQAVRAIDRPLLVDFATCDPARLARYRQVPRHELLGRLAAAQQRLISAVSIVGGTEMNLIGCHEFDGDVSLADMLAFLPGHQADHATQLELLL
jgi:hypothetical protein